MNGGFWPTGTAYVAPVLYNHAPDFALNLLEDLVSSLPQHHYTEWIGAEGQVADAQHFMMAVGLPLVSVMSILNNRSLLSYF